MTKRWNDKAQDELDDNILKIPPAALIETFRNYCKPIDEPKNAETYMNKNITKIKTSKKTAFAYSLHLNCIKQIPEWFNMYELITNLHAYGLTNNVLQHIILSHMYCMGIIDKRVVIVTDNKGKKKPQHEFKYLTDENPIPCKFLINGKCTYPWRTGLKVEI